MALLKATISGSFKAADKDVESYENVTGFLPALDEDKANQMIIRRYARIWIGQTLDKDGNAKYKRVGRVREVFIDSVEDVEGKRLSYEGKKITEMNFEELQDLAAANDLSGVPLYKSGSLAFARKVAFAEYANKVLGWTDKDGKPIDHRVEGFNPAKFEAIIADDKIRRSGDVPADIEETLDHESLVMAKKAAPTQRRLTLEQLKEIAKSKNVPFNANIGYDALHKKLYKEDAA